MFSKTSSLCAKVIRKLSRPQKPVCQILSYISVTAGHPWRWTDRWTDGPMDGPMMQSTPTRYMQTYVYSHVHTHPSSWAESFELGSQGRLGKERQGKQRQG